MPYLDRTLGPDEKINYRARYHWWWNFRSLGLLNLFNQIVITDRRVLKKTGILNVETQSLAFRNVESKDLRQSIWGRLLGFGDVTIFGTGGQSETFAGLARPAEFLREFDRASSRANLSEVKSAFTP